jgi:serine/threonine-protein kinase
LQYLTTTIGNFPLIKKIGNGGQAVIYFSQNPTTREDCAIKIPLVDDFGPFIDEVNITKQLIHPGIIKQTLLEIKSVDGKREIAILMDYYPSNLSHVDREHTTLEQAIDCICQICDAIQFIHQGGFIHRDLKKENILISKNGRPIITDFGIALLKNYKQSDAKPMGDPRYAAPELYGNNAEQASDIYALGVIACEILTGKLPFRSYKSDSNEQMKDLACQHIYDAPPSMREIPPDIERCLHWALRKNPNERPTVTQFKEALQNALHTSINWGLPQTETLLLLPETLTDLRHRTYVENQETQILLFHQLMKLRAFLHI